MDSISQAALGAAVGEAVLGRKVGYRAALWGVIGGTIPDLDILVNPLLDEVAQLSWHRGYSHSLLFVIALAPLLAWVIRKIHGSGVSWRQWTRLTFLVLFTHVLLDCFTVYGTQLFLPFSNYMVGFNSIAIVDPLYTVPLLIGVIMALFMSRQSRRRRIFNYIGLAVSTVYLLIALGIKFHVGDVIENSLEDQGISYHRYMTAPTIFNAVLWRATVEVDGGYQVGYYSLLDSDDRVDFRYVPRRSGLINTVKHEKAVQKLLWFSNGYYVLSEGCDWTQFHDLRFGEVQTDMDRPGKYTFTWDVVEKRDGLERKIYLERADFSLENPGKAFSALWTRLKGN